MKILLAALFVLITVLPLPTADSDEGNCLKAAPTGWYPMSVSLAEAACRAMLADCGTVCLQGPGFGCGFGPRDPVTGRVTVIPCQTYTNGDHCACVCG